MTEKFVGFFPKIPISLCSSLWRSFHSASMESFKRRGMSYFGIVFSRWGVRSEGDSLWIAGWFGRKSFIVRHEEMVAGCESLEATAWVFSVVKSYRYALKFQLKFSQQTAGCMNDLTCWVRLKIANEIRKTEEDWNLEKGPVEGDWTKNWLLWVLEVRNEGRSQTIQSRHSNVFSINTGAPSIKGSRGLRYREFEGRSCFCG